MKKILAIVLAAMMALTLCACGDSAEDTAEAAAPAADTAAAPEAPAAEAPEAPAGEAVEGEDTGEASQEQSFELFPSDGYEKTFDGYIEWVRAALQSQEGNPNLESDLASLDEVTEDTYDPSAMPFAMQIQFGLITSYEDFLG